jgi:hypothetical protein
MLMVDSSKASRSEWAVKRKSSAVCMRKTYLLKAIGYRFHLSVSRG